MPKPCMDNICANIQLKLQESNATKQNRTMKVNICIRNASI